MRSGNNVTVHCDGNHKSVAVINGVVRNEMLEKNAAGVAQSTDGEEKSIGCSPNHPMRYESTHRRDSFYLHM